MPQTPTIRPSALSRPDLGWDPDRWTGFAPCAPEELAPAGPPSLVLGDQGWETQELTPPGHVGPLGCHLIRDIEICRTGYAFAHSRFIHDLSHTSTAALGWLRQPDFPGNPLTHPPPRRIAVERPVLLAFGAGYPVYGHWLLDFLPRVAIAQQTMGAAFADLIIPLPSDTPDFVRAMLRHFLAIPDDQILQFDFAADLLVCARVCLPTFAHDGHYVFHSFFRNFYQHFVPAARPLGPRRICVSRRDFEGSTRGVHRVFKARETFERLALARGYAIVRPETLSIAGQVALFAGADRIVGEHGSGLHNTIFSPPGAVCGYLPLTNPVQLRIGQAFAQPNIILRAAMVPDANGVPSYTVPETSLAQLLDQMT